MKKRFMIYTLFTLFLSIGLVSGELFSVEPCGTTQLVDNGDGTMTYGNNCMDFTFFDTGLTQNFDVNNHLDQDTFTMTIQGITEESPLNDTEIEFVSLNWTLDVSAGYPVWTSTDDVFSFGYIINKNTFKSVANITNYPFNYNDSHLMLKNLVRKSKAQDTITFIEPIVDGVPQPVNTSITTQGQNTFYWQNVGRGSLIEIDPLYVVDYSPNPAQHIYYGYVGLNDTSNFPTQIDITSGVSDNLTTSNYETRRVTTGVTSAGVNIVHIEFDETSGTTMDDVSPLDNDGFYSGSPNLTVTGTQGSAIQFDGLNDYAQLDHINDYNVNASEDIVVCFGFNSYGNIGNGKPVLDKDNSNGWIVQGNDDQLRFSTDRTGSGNKNLDTVYDFKDSNWHKVCFFSGFSNMYSYVDGVLDKSLSASQSGSIINTLNITLGTNTGFDNYASFGMDDLCIMKGQNLNISQIASSYNLSAGCDGLFQDYSQGIAIEGRWAETYNSTYDYFARVYKRGLGSDTFYVEAYNTSDDLAGINVNKTLNGEGWFNINVTPLLQHEKNVINLSFTILRIYSENSQNISEIYLRAEVNDTEPPVIDGSQCNITNALNGSIQSQFTCLEEIEFECNNITDNLDIDYVLLEINGVNETATQDVDHWHFYVDDNSNGTTIYDWTAVHAVDILGQMTSLNLSKTANYTCLFDEYINITHSGTLNLDQKNLTSNSVVILWNTSNPSDSLVEYSSNPANLSNSLYDNTLVTQHQVLVTGLQPNTTYHYRVTSTVNPTQTLTGFNFTTPELSATIVVSAGADNATINSTSNATVNSTIYYDENGTYLLSNTQPVYSLNHSQFLSGLENLTTYFVNQTFCTESPQECFSYLYNFTTTSGCTENWTSDSISCQVNDSYLLTYTDNNACGTTYDLPVDNGTYQSCNYCSENLVQVLGNCTVDDNQTVDWVDTNKVSCCDVTGLSSDCTILTYPYNDTTSKFCAFGDTELGDLQCPPQFDFTKREKEYCIANIPINYSNESFKCISYIKNSEGEIIQTNPEYKEGEGWLYSILYGTPESRQYFEPANGLVNFYITEKNLLPDNQYVLYVDCSSTQRTLRSTHPFVQGYESFDFVFTRTRWMMDNAGGILAFILVMFILLFVGGWLWRSL